MYWIQHLFFVILGRIRHLWFSWNCLGTNRISQDICFVVALICGFPEHRKTTWAMSYEWEQADKCFILATHHYLNLAFAHLQIMLIIDIHPLQGTTHPLICSYKENNCKSTCRIEKETIFFLLVLKEATDISAKSWQLTIGLNPKENHASLWTLWYKIRLHSTSYPFHKPFSGLIILEI